MISASREQSLESILALTSAMRGCPDISPEESRRNIEKNCVRIAKIEQKVPREEGGFKYICEKAGSGLQITEDGFVLTAGHVISGWLDDWKSSDNSDGRYFVAKRNPSTVDCWPLDITCYALDITHDVALIKVQYPFYTLAQPVRFKLTLDPTHQTTPLNQDIVLLTRNNPDLLLEQQSGRIIDRSYSFQVSTSPIRNIDSVRTTIPAVKGMSGSPVISLDGSLMGIAVANEWVEIPEYRIIGSSFAKLVYLQKVVSKFVSTASQKLQSLT
ncbi:trypsin-like peptidase domain-containing protein [Candidatus Woesearchaeota archaeon]|nr:trypsin-like peptidase domain-containing protein [Candidatus Woesearchaeota archaeon]